MMSIIYKIKTYELYKSVSCFQMEQITGIEPAY